MPATKPARPESPPALRYVGDNSISGIPARDLSPADLERLAAKPYTKRRLASDAGALAALLIGTGLYALDKPSTDEKE